MHRTFESIRNYIYIIRGRRERVRSWWRGGAGQTRAGRKQWVMVVWHAVTHPHRHGTKRAPLFEPSCRRHSEGRRAAVSRLHSSLPCYVPASLSWCKILPCCRVRWCDLAWPDPSSSHWPHSPELTICRRSSHVFATNLFILSLYLLHVFLLLIPALCTWKYYIAS